MSGVVVTTAVRTGPTNIQVTPTATFFVAGVTTRGPEGSAIAVHSIAEYETVYGGYTSSGYVHQTLETFFEEGGSTAYVSRVIPDDATSATCYLDNAVDSDCLALTASGEGTWANTELSTTVTHPSAGVSFRIAISLSGETVYTTTTHTSPHAAGTGPTKSRCAKSSYFMSMIYFALCFNEILLE